MSPAAAHERIRKRWGHPTPRQLTRVGFLKRAGRQRLSSLRCAQGQALSAAKDLRLARREILRCAQDDTSHLAGSFPKKLTRVSTPAGGLRLPAPPAQLLRKKLGVSTGGPMRKPDATHCIMLEITSREGISDLYPPKRRDASV